MYANTSGSRTLAGSSDQVNVSVTWDRGPASDNGSSLASASQEGDSGEAGNANGTSGDAANPVPSLGVLAGLGALAGTALAGRRRV